MIRTHTTAALGALLLLAGVSAQAQTQQYQITNFTFSGGDPQFPVATDVTFTNLQITQKFADNTTSVLNVPNLDTATIEFDSAPFSNPDVTHGALTSSVLSGFFDFGPGSTEPFDIETSLGGPITTVPVQRSFSATLLNPTGGSVTNIFAVDANNPGQVYGAGTFGDLALPTPEPSPLAPLAAVALGVAALSLVARRRAAKDNQ